jgi:L-arabinonolactonase
LTPASSVPTAHFYFADTFQKELWRYDYNIETGAATNRRVLRDLKDDPGFADGSTVDADGCVWNARVIAGELVRYAPDGSVDMLIGMPVRNITSVMFGGDKLDEIYVTSMARVSHPAAHDHFAAEVKPQFAAGALFRIKGLGIKGLPEPRFAG